jgi:hypothetical protein
MKPVKPVKVVGLCLASLMAVFAFATAGSASAKVLLFVPSAGFPAHLTGKGLGSTLETLSGKKVTSSEVHALALITNSTLFSLRLDFLKALGEGIAPCTNTASSNTILADLLGHLGFVDPSGNAGVLLDIPAGFKFTCEFLSVKETFLVQGHVIGLITAPAILKAGEKVLTVKFEQSKGEQKHTEFLLGSTRLTNQFQETSPSEKGFEKSAQQGEATLTDQSGTFELKDE